MTIGRLTHANMSIFGNSLNYHPLKPCYPMLYLIHLTHCSDVGA